MGHAEPSMDVTITCLRSLFWDDYILLLIFSLWNSCLSLANTWNSGISLWSFRCYLLSDKSRIKQNLFLIELSKMQVIKYPHTITPQKLVGKHISQYILSRLWLLYFSENNSIRLSQGYSTHKIS